MNHKTDMREALQLCVDAMLHDGVPTDPYHPRRVALTAAEDALASRPDAQAAIEFSGVKDVLAEGKGFWRSCAGCYECEDGHPVGHYPHSAVLGCNLGNGCSECGGIGAIWDDTDYGAMADVMAASMNGIPDAQESLASENVVKDSPPKVSQGLAQADEIRAADPGEELQGWSVTVERNGVRLLTIEKDSVGGVENIGDFAPLVRDCAEHLLSFIGRDAQADKSGAATTPDAIRSLQRLEAACDQRAALLTPEAYLAAEKAPGMREALYELDMARREACEVLARAAAPQAEAAQGVADGWRLMPPSLTQSMRMAMGTAAAEYMKRTGGNSLDVIYEAGFAAAPDREHEVPCAKLVGRWDYGKPGCVRYEPDFPRGDIPEGTPVYVGSAPSPDREQVGNTKEDRYQMVCAAAYQLAGVVNAPLRFLDALSDAANGEPMNNAIDLLPVTIDEFGSASPSRECGERQECHHGQDNGACGWCYDEAARGEQMAMNREDVERQYKDGIHIGSGLPRATCPCGLCSKHRFGFNSGGGVPIAAASASTLSERSECTCGNGLGHARHCPAFDESKMRYEPFALPQPQAAEPRGLTLEQREAIKWALGVAHSGAKATPEGLLMFNRWKALCALLSKGE